MPCMEDVGRSNRTNTHRLLKKAEVLAKVKCSNSGLYNLMKTGFPKPVRLGPRTVRWIEAEVDAFIAGCIRSRETNLQKAMK
jgi:prophage regulatory protein